MEAEDRIERSQAKSRVQLYATEFDTTKDEYGTYGYDGDDPLTLMLKAELSQMIYESFPKVGSKGQLARTIESLDNDAEDRTRK